MAADNAQIIALLEKASALYNEAQDAYDFQAFAHASSTREKATALMLEAFQALPVLQQYFPETWTIMNFPDKTQCDFSEHELGIARKLLLPAGND